MTTVVYKFKSFSRKTALVIDRIESADGDGITLTLPISTGEVDLGGKRICIIGGVAKLPRGITPGRYIPRIITATGAYILPPITIADGIALSDIDTLSLILNGQRTAEALETRIFALEAKCEELAQRLGSSQSFKL